MAGDQSGSGAGGGAELLDSLRNLAVTLVAIIQTRLEILSTEIEEEKLLVAQQILLGATAFFFLGLGIILLAILLVVLFWDTHRLAVIGVLAAAFLAIGTAAAIVFRNRAQARTTLFAASLAELARDHEQLKR